MGGKRDAFAGKMKVKLAQWNAEIDKFQALADQAQGDAQVRFQRQVGDIKSKRHVLEGKMEELQKAGEGAWADVRKGVETAWESLDDAIQSAKSRFKPE